MTHEEQLVRKFYEVIWNNHNKSAIPTILHASFVFRGSLGIDKKGHDEFVEYLDMIHSALANYQCTIKEIVSEGSKVFAKMQFTGIHQGTLLGIDKSKSQLGWCGFISFQRR